MQTRHFIVSETRLAEDTDELTREDVLLPSQNMGKDLHDEVTKDDVIEPEHEADKASTSRLLTLAGLQAPRY